MLDPPQTSVEHGGTRRRRSLLVLALLVMTPMFGVTALYLINPWPNTRPHNIQPILTPGIPVPKAQAAPTFSLPRLARSGSVGVSDFSGKVVVLNFWASWCTPCRAEAPVLQSLWRQYRSQGVQFLGIDTNDSPAAAASFQQQFGVTYPSVVDQGGKVASRYGVVGLPTTFIVAPDGLIRFEVLGKIESESFERALRQVARSNQPVSP